LGNDKANAKDYKKRKGRLVVGDSGRVVITVFMCVRNYLAVGASRLNFEEYSKETLWQLLVDAVHASVMYPSHKAYVRDSILPQKPDVSAVELTARLGMPLGEALVILEELKEAKKNQSMSTQQTT